MPRRPHRPDLPRDPAAVLRALRACRTAMASLCAEVKIGGPVYIATNAIMAAIDTLARVLTGSGTYFHGTIVPVWRNWQTRGTWTPLLR